MSLYEGIDSAVAPSPKPEKILKKEPQQSKESVENEAEKPQATDTKPAGGWSQAGLKLLQQQMNLKKAQATTAMRDRQRGTPVLPTPAIAPVVDLSSKAKGAGEDKKPFRAPAAPAPRSSPSLLKPRKALVLDGPPLSFIPIAAKEENVLIFGEIVVEDEYNPLIPNDYQKCLAKREAEKRKQREEQRKRDAEERERRSRERVQQEEEVDLIKESQKRAMGAAIAPPQALVEQDKRVLEEPTFTPDFGSGSKGLGVAAKIMEKMGYKQGSGLGKSGQGMATALRVKKIGEREGMIIDDSAVKDEPDEILMPPPPPLAPPPPTLAVNLTPVVSIGDPPPITEILKNPSKLMLLRNMVGPGEVDEELEREVKEEMVKYGEVIKCTVYEMPKPVADNEAVRIFVEFVKVDQAIKAVVDINGRYFGGRLVRAGFYEPAKFARMDLTSES